MKRTAVLIFTALILLLLCACGSSGKTASPPETHAIAYDETLDTLKDEYGADAYDHALDHVDSM